LAQSRDPRRQLITLSSTADRAVGRSWSRTRNGKIGVPCQSSDRAGPAIMRGRFGRIRNGGQAPHRAGRAYICAGGR
jgi:hypothetical protein